MEHISLYIVVYLYSQNAYLGKNSIPLIEVSLDLVLRQLETRYSNHMRR